MLPADRGDCLFIEYGASDEVEHRILIDGGHMSAYEEVRERLLDLPTDAHGRRHFELLVVTHVDADHIDGVIGLLQDRQLNCWFNDVWFNGWRHLAPLTEDDGTPVPDPVTLGPKQGEFLGALFEMLGQPWNRYFTGGAIFVADHGPLPRVTLSGGLAVTLLSPTLATLRKLRKEWVKVLEDADAKPGLGPDALVEFGSMLRNDSIVTLGDETRRSTLDNSEANGASIAFLMEFQGRRLLLTGDGFADVIRKSLDRWRDEQSDPPERVKLDAFKLAHHGSKRNITPQLMDVISCSDYLVSTNGAGNAKHPDVQAVAIVRDGHHNTAEGDLPTIRFNYDSRQTEVFKDAEGITTLYEKGAILSWDTPYDRADARVDCR